MQIVWFDILRGNNFQNSFTHQIKIVKAAKKSSFSGDIII